MPGTGGNNMKDFPLLSILGLLILSACAPAAQAIQTAMAQTQATARMSDLLISCLNKLLEDGATLCNMSAQSFTLPEFRQKLARTKGDHALVLAAPSGKGIAPEAVTELNQAITGWDLAHSVWYAKLNGWGAPRAPDAVRYSELVDYVGVEKLPFVGGVPGAGEVEQDQVIGILLGMATEHFSAAQALLIGEMQ
jgi:hypothetical protein